MSVHNLSKQKYLNNTVHTLNLFATKRIVSIYFCIKCYFALIIKLVSFVLLALEMAP